ncbi:heme exporter protein CcmD [Shinella sp. H4-D48]|uniref:heme exporter protein CcmD n=1 Tax=Shinella sp. H4-D48 TaxID=2925841 RepID=UPI001F534EC4|nr:heme exporter protein CcmD [Shinella sp. H4-D48]UNK38318.1 heme exporter protein CcmD [Shinella sp. H4-D48]
MSHAFYVTASYGAAFGVVFGLALWVWLDHRGRHRELARLEAAGIRRRSARQENAE